MIGPTALMAENWTMLAAAASRGKPDRKPRNSPPQARTGHGSRAALIRDPHSTRSTARGRCRLTTGPVIGPSGRSEVQGLTKKLHPWLYARRSGCIGQPRENGNRRCGAGSWGRAGTEWRTEGTAVRWTRSRRGARRRRRTGGNGSAWRRETISRPGRTIFELPRPVTSSRARLPPWLSENSPAS